MKTKLIALGLVAVVLGGLDYYSKSDLVDGWETYSNSDLGIVFQHPPEYNGSREIYRGGKKYISLGKSGEGMQDIFFGIASDNNWDKPSNIPPEPIKIDGKAGLFYKGTQSPSVIAIPIKNNQFFLIHNLEPNDSPDREILSTFKFTK